MSTVLILRPAPDAARTAARVEEAGFIPLIAPVMAIEPVVFTLPAMEGIDALIATSPHALPDTLLARVPRLPFYCVGKRVEQRVHDAGFPVAMAAADSDALCEAMRDAPPRHALYFSAEDIHTDLAAALAPHTEVTRLITYRAAACEAWPGDQLAAIAAADIVLLTSERSLSLFLALTEKYGMAVAGKKAICLSHAIAVQAAMQGMATETAERPHEDALIAALRTSC